MILNGFTEKTYPQKKAGYAPSGDPKSKRTAMKILHLCLYVLLSTFAVHAQIPGLQFLSNSLPAKAATSIKSAPGLIKIPLDSNMIVDFSGAWGRAAYSTFRYFDSQADPLHGNFLADSTSGNTSIGAEDYYGYRRHRLIAGNFQQRYRLREIWVCTSPANPVPDTVDITIGDSARSATYIYQYTNNTTPGIRIITQGRKYEWKKVWEGDTTVQYFLTSVRWRKMFYQEGGYWMAPETNITGIIFYGEPTGTGDTTFNYASDEVVAKAASRREIIRNLTGSNFYNVFPIKDCDSFTIMRKGLQQTNRFHYDTLVLQPQKDFSSSEYYDSVSMSVMSGRRMYYQMMGPSTHVLNQTKSTSWRPVDDTAADRRNPLSYRTLGRNMYSIAYAYGSNPNADDRYIKQKNGHIKASGTHWGIEPGNELNGVYFPNQWLDPIGTGCMMLMAIDGWNNRWGKGYGVKNADPNFKIYVPGTAGIDVQYQRAVIKFLQYAYNTAHPPIDYIGFHAYPGSLKKGVGPFTSELPGSHITFPSDKSYYQDQHKALESIYREWRGYIPITINEYGADKSFLRTKTENGMYDTTLFGVVRYDKYNEAQSLGIFLTSCKLMGAATSEAERVQYAFKDDEAPNKSSRYTNYSGSGYVWYFYNKDWQLDSTRYWDNFYYDQGISRALFWYGSGQIIDSASGGLFLFKFRHSKDPAKVVYAVWKDSSSTGKGIPVKIPVGIVADAQKMTGSFKSLQPAYSKATVKNGFIHTTATTLHQFFFVTEKIRPQPLIMKKKK